MRAAAGDRDVGARRVNVHRSRGSGPQELMVDRPHTTADFEDGLPVEATRTKRLDQRSSRAYRALLPVGAKMLCRVTCVELAIEGAVAG